MQIKKGVKELDHKKICIIAIENCRINYTDILKIALDNKVESSCVRKLNNLDELEKLIDMLFETPTIWWLQYDHYLYSDGDIRSKRACIMKIIGKIKSNPGHVVLVAHEKKIKNLPEWVIYIKRELRNIDEKVLDQVIKAMIEREVGIK